MYFIKSLTHLTFIIYTINRWYTYYVIYVELFHTNVLFSKIIIIEWCWCMLMLTSLMFIYEVNYAQNDTLANFRSRVTYENHDELTFNSSMDKKSNSNLHYLISVWNISTSLLIDSLLSKFYSIRWKYRKCSKNRNISF